MLLVVMLAQGCATATKIYWAAGSGSIPLSVVDTQKGFASFEPTGQSSARLRVDLGLHVDNSQGVDVEICEPADKASAGVELGSNPQGITLYYMAGQRGEFIPEGQYSRCMTSAGVKVCARMSGARDISLCFNQQWQDDLKKKGEAVEISPAKITLSWQCTETGSCSLSSGGAPMADGNFNLYRTAHSDPAMLEAIKEKTRLNAAGLGAGGAALWQNSGFTNDEAVRWGAGISPIEAAKWKKAGYGIDDGKSWLSKTGSFDVANSWKVNGFTVSDYATWSRYMGPDAAKLWRHAGYDLAAAGKWVQSGVSTPAEATSISKRCPKGVDAIEALWGANPYDVGGKCYRFVGQTVQILSKNSGLYSLGDGTVLVKFGKQSAPPHLFQGIVKGGDAFTYTNAIGGEKVVPSVEVVNFQKSM